MELPFTIRRAVARDADAIAKLSASAASEEGALTSLEVERIRAHGFGSSALFEAWVAQERANAPIVAHAIITKGYDVRRGAPNVVLCELYVAPEQRRTGLARKMMSAVARRAREIGARARSSFIRIYVASSSVLLYEFLSPKMRSCCSYFVRLFSQFFFP